MAKSIRTRFAATGEQFTLASVDPAATSGLKDGDKARAATDKLGSALLDAQTRLYAERSQGLLIVLQGMDACGKDGAVKHVVSLFNPSGLRVTAFKAPSDEEKKHNFLWRFRPLLPAPGNVAVFNRSHYEDVGIVRVHGWATPEEIERRYDEINRFEKEAVDSGIAVVKCFLHVSYEETRQRMLDRLADPTKRWKFKEGDLDEREHWDEYMAAYDAAIRRCSSEAAPWFVIPADHKWHRDWVLSHLLTETLAAMKPQYPAMADLDLRRLRARIKGSTPGAPALVAAAAKAVAKKVAPKAAATKAAASKAAAPQAAVATEAAPAAVAKKAVAKKAVAKTAVAKKAVAKTAVAKTAVAKKVVAKKVVAKKVAAPPAAAQQAEPTLVVDNLPSAPAPVTPTPDA